jgi:hypothetical protein
MKTTLNGRPLVLDLFRMSSSDDEGQLWIQTMRSEGAVVSQDATPLSTQRKQSSLRRLFGFIRGNSDAVSAVN